MIKIEPITREEQFYNAILDEGGAPIPITREEKYLAKIAGEDVDVPIPITRKERFLNEIVEHGVMPEGTIQITENGITDVAQYAYAEVNVSGGQIPEHGVFFTDYDGSIVTAWASDEVESKTALPDNPTHDGLVSQGWNWSLANIKSHIANYQNADVYVGQMYKTSSGLTEIDITVTKVTGKTVTCKMVGNKDWGDGTTGSETSHTYEDYGDYTITCNGTSIPAGTSSSGGMFESSSSNMNRFWCTAIRVGDGVTSIGDYAFCNCRSLKSITISYSVTSIGDSAFYYCSALKSITIPDGVTSISGSAFYNCFSLKSITIPDGVTSIGGSAFYACRSITSVTLPGSITSIGDGAFYGCYAAVEYDLSTAISTPTLSGTNTFNGINGICKIIVPDSLYDDWIAAANWSTYANYIYKASEA